MTSTTQNNSSYEQHSKFPHERKAIEEIVRRIKKHSLGTVVANFEVYDNNTNDYYECDVIIITAFGIYLVELKHWSGRIQIAPYTWIINGTKYRPDPHRTNRFKCKILRGLYQHQLPAYSDIWFESIVVLTNLEAEVEGASTIKMKKHDPTFESIDKLIDYLRFQQKETRRVLSDIQVQSCAKMFEKLRTKTKHEQGFNFPGYEIVDRLTQSTDHLELILRTINTTNRTLIRFRIFYPPDNLESIERERFIRRAHNTLNAVSKIGEHPNILKVWAIPDESGSIIEGSDWSEEGTLRDLINSYESELSIEESLNICHGILRGLAISHKEGVIHRAVKPENILMLNGVPKLMNFDLSYQLETDNHITVISDPAELKKNACTAPEVLQGKDVDERTDFFSVGVILYELLLKEKPFKIATELSKMGGRLSQELLSKLAKREVPQNICNTIEHIVRYARTERIDLIDDIFEALGEKNSAVLTRKEKINEKFKQEDSYDVYNIESLIAEGVESQVYKAYTLGQEQVVLKVFNQDVPLQRIRNEEFAASAVKSAYLVNATRLGHWKNERFFLEFGFVEGRLMREDISSNNWPDLETFIAVARCLFEAIHVLHHHFENDKESPLLHSDIKPDNIILTLDKKAVLIDFGIAGKPRVDSFKGTEGYVALDLIDAADLQFCQEGDLFSLGVSLFEWLFCKHPYDTFIIGAAPINPLGIRTDIPQPLINWLLKAVQLTSQDRFSSIDDMQKEFNVCFGQTLHEIESDEMEREIDSSEEKMSKEPAIGIIRTEQEGNPFVAYLNSLHNTNVNNENALAESQAINPYFSYIHVPLKVTEYIYNQLTDEEGSHVILTGHAGDGKSTIGLELFKRFMNIPHTQSLSEPMQPVEEINFNKISIKLIKDMSELTESDRSSLLERLTQGTDDRYLIISNTGMLLYSFEQLTESKSDWRELQSKLLEGLESSTPKSIGYKSGVFKIINLVRGDNVETACKVFERMLASELWDVCNNTSCREACPIYQNVKILQEHKTTVLRRVEFIYRRLYEYGCRLTLRQITGHIAYAITAGLNYETIKRFSEQAVAPPLRNFLFYNRFFGDCGDGPDLVADQLAAVRSIRALEPGFRPDSKIDRELWMKETETVLPRIGQSLQPYFKYLRKVGSGIVNDDSLVSHSARMQARRLLYCFGQFNSSNKEKTFVSTFLGSPMLVDFISWQKNGGSLSALECNRLKRGILHVLQEHFTGVRLPENTGDQEIIYVTLNRRSFEVRQSAQIVLARFHAENFDLTFEECDSEISVVRYQIKLKELQMDCELILDLPFLDYVTNRHQGEIAQKLQSFYIDRLERFKVGLLSRANSINRGNMMLVRLQLNHTFKSQTFSILNNRLEVI